MTRRRARFRVVARLDMASRTSEGTITIDGNTFAVRPLRRRRQYILPLETVAEMVVRGIIDAEAKAKRAAKLAARKARRGR